MFPFAGLLFMLLIAAQGYFFMDWTYSSNPLIRRGGPIASLVGLIVFGAGLIPAVRGLVVGRAVVDERGIDYPFTFGRSRSEWHRVNSMTVTGSGGSQRLVIRMDSGKKREIMLDNLDRPHEFMRCVDEYWRSVGGEGVREGS